MVVINKIVPLIKEGVVLPEDEKDHHVCNLTLTYQGIWEVALTMIKENLQDTEKDDVSHWGKWKITINLTKKGINDMVYPNKEKSGQIISMRIDHLTQ